MNKEEAIEKIGNLKKYRSVIVPLSDSEVVKLNDVLEIVNQIDEDEVLNEPLGVLLVDMPEHSIWEYSYLYRHPHDVYGLNFTDDHNVVLSSKRAIKITEAEAKEKYPNFKWVSLEELENE